jgi:hypothetical protein
LGIMGGGEGCCCLDMVMPSIQFDSQCKHNKVRWILSVLPTFELIIIMIPLNPVLVRLIIWNNWTTDCAVAQSRAEPLLYRTWLDIKFSISFTVHVNHTDTQPYLFLEFFSPLDSIRSYLIQQLLFVSSLASIVYITKERPLCLL